MAGAEENGSAFTNYQLGRREEQSNTPGWRKWKMEWAKRMVYNLSVNITRRGGNGNSLENRAKSLCKVAVMRQEWAGSRDKQAAAWLRGLSWHMRGGDLLPSSVNGRHDIRSAQNQSRHEEHFGYSQELRCLSVESIRFVLTTGPSRGLAHYSCHIKRHLGQHFSHAASRDVLSSKITWF